MAWPDLEPEIVTRRSSGDSDQKTDLARFGRIGIFTVEVDRALLDGSAEAAVHSLKDMTTTLEEGVRLAAIFARGPVEDVLISPSGATLATLGPGARIATGSMRRAAMLRAVRPDIRIVGIRGNVDTRLAKLAAGEADAMVLARAGLVRLGLDQHITEVLDTERFLPAVGQGLVGITCRDDDDQTYRKLVALRDEAAWAEGLAERSFLRGLRGGCNVPVGGHARVTVGGELQIRGRVLAVDGSLALDGERRGRPADAEALGADLADELIDQGAEQLIEASRS